MPLQFFQPGAKSQREGWDDATRTLIATWLPLSSRYVTSALAPTLSFPSMVVFLSMRNIMVRGLVCSRCDMADPSVSVNEFLLTDAIVPVTDWA